MRHWHFAILAVLTLGGCALPGSPVTTSFLSTMHPSQEFCASRGLALDSATKQCMAVTAPHPASGDSVTGSLPQASQGPPQPSSTPPASPAPPSPSASAAPSASSNPSASPSSASSVPSTTPPSAPEALLQGPRQGRQSADTPVPIETDAEIDPGLKVDGEQMSEFAHFVRASGYRCDSVSALRPLPSARGYKLACNRSNYRYAIEDNGGRLVVTVE